jgi:RNA polymerase sigma-70 factor (ECF subfamily)
VLDASARESWDVLADRLGGFIRRRVRPEDADDVLQDVLVRIYKHVGDLADDGRFGPWVYAIARNAVIDHLRRRTDPTDVPGAEIPADAPEDDAEQPLLNCVAPFVARLPSPYREAMTLVELQGLSQVEAADVGGVSVSGMKSRVQRGRRMLRKMFEECCALTVDGRGKVIEAVRREPCDTCTEDGAVLVSRDQVVRRT